MSEQVMISAKPQNSPAIQGSVLQRAAITPIAHGVLQRCSNGVECPACRAKREQREQQEGTLQRAAVNTAPTPAVPPVVHDVLSSPGQPLDRSTRAFMEPRFGHDFSGVRVHTDARAAESARAVNALAYTVGRDVVFGAGQYMPGTMGGKRLLAHELTHTIQQSQTTSLKMKSELEIANSNDLQEMEAEQISNRVLDDRNHEMAHQIMLQEGIKIARQPDAASLKGEESTGIQDENTLQWLDFLKGNGISAEDILSVGPLPVDNRMVLAAAGAQALPVPAPTPTAPTPSPGGPGGKVIPFPQRPPAPKPSPKPFPLPSPFAVGVIIAIIILFYPSKTASPWSDELNPITGEPYHGPDEYDFVRRLNPQQREELRKWYDQLNKPASQPSPGTQPVPQPVPESKRRRKRKNLKAYPLCWTHLLPPPVLKNGVPWTIFVRTSSERDEDEAVQARLQLQRREFRDRSFNPKVYHVHHVVPLFLGGPDDLVGINGYIIYATVHLRGHGILRDQPQMTDPDATYPLPPLLTKNMYDHPIGTPYELVGFKGLEGCPE